MTDYRDRPAEQTSLDGPPPEEEWPPREWRDLEQQGRRDGDPESGRHLIWVMLAAVIFFFAWYTM